MHHRHGVLNGYALLARGLNIPFGTAQYGKKIVVLAQQQMGAVELGRHMHNQIEIAHRREGDLRVGDRLRQVTAETEQRFGLPVAHRLNRRYRAVAVLLRRREAEDFFDIVQQRLGRDLGNPHGAIALHVGVAAQRTDASPFFTDVAAHQ